MALTKADIIDSVADNNGYSKREATDKVGEILLEIIKRTLASGEKGGQEKGGQIFEKGGQIFGFDNLLICSRIR